jgi:hypothetical protein
MRSANERKRGEFFALLTALSMLTEGCASDMAGMHSQESGGTGGKGTDSSGRSVRKPDRPARAGRLDQLVVELLVVPLPVVVLDVLGDDPPQVRLAERDHLPEALLWSATMLTRENPEVRGSYE